jgi:ABC-type branched-subunit amino acid transport system ATPase component
MLRDLRISGFRGLRELTMSGLGRVNLLVGTNNCGKTTVLEAISLLSAPGTATPLWQVQSRRGEFVEHAERQMDVAQILNGRELAMGHRFHIIGLNTDGSYAKMSAFFVVSDVTPKEVEDDDGEDEVGSPTALREPLALQLEWREGPSLEHVTLPVPTVRLPVTRLGGVHDQRMLSARDASTSGARRPVFFIATDGLTRQQIVSMFERIVLTPDETTVLQALHTIEPGIERIASIGTQAKRVSRGGRGGLAMMVAGQRVPVGSMGDGLWRLLGVALAMVQARGGVLLVDEIDTGLHYSVLVDMWRLVLETARRLDVQVFATTHSRDCYEALAAVTEPGRTEISLQRIERGRVEAVAFTELEIRQAGERGLEVR